MDALTPKTIDLTPLIPVLRALSLCIMGTFLKHSILLIKVILGKVIMHSSKLGTIGLIAIGDIIGEEWLIKKYTDDWWENRICIMRKLPLIQISWI